MLWVYVPRAASLDRVAVLPNTEVPENAVWFDLVNPNTAEDKLVERQVGVAVPTREEMQEIEVTSRLYVENGARYLDVSVGYRDAKDHACHLHPDRTAPDHRAL
jgi:magnesium transporter